MKLYERQSGNTEGRLFATLPAAARIDGKNFSRFTHDLARPYDVRLSELMGETTRFLVGVSNACIGYTQSDEITLIWGGTRPTYFDGRINKVNSILAAKASVYFNRRLGDYLPDKEVRVAAGNADLMPVFDCRVWNLPSEAEACNVLLWREWDATKNSISMAAQSLYSHKQLFGKHCGEMQEMLFQKGVNWNDYPAFFKRGRYVQHRMIARPFSVTELESLPPKHEARLNPNLVVERRTLIDVEMPVFNKVTNKPDVVFRGEEPLTESHSCNAA